MSALLEKKTARLRRKKRVRQKIFGFEERPRLSVFSSARHIYAQIVSDGAGHTLVAASTLEKDVRAHPKFQSKIEAASFVGKLVAKRALDRGINKVVFDRNGFSYHGRVRAVAEGAREGGLQF